LSGVHEKYWGEQGWPFSFQTWHQMWVEFVVGSCRCFERFFSGYFGFLHSSKNNISKFQFNLDTVDEELPCGCATANSHLSFIYYLLNTFCDLGLGVLAMLATSSVRNKLNLAVAKTN